MSLKHMYLDPLHMHLNCIPDRDLNLEPFNLESSVLTIITPCFGFCCIKKKLYYEVSNSPVLFDFFM